MPAQQIDFGVGCREGRPCSRAAFSAVVLQGTSVPGTEPQLTLDLSEAHHQTRVQGGPAAPRAGSHSAVRRGQRPVRAAFAWGATGDEPSAGWRAGWALALRCPCRRVSLAGVRACASCDTALSPLVFSYLPTVPLLLALVVKFLPCNLLGRGTDGENNFSHDLIMGHFLAESFLLFYKTQQCGFPCRWVWGGRQGWCSSQEGAAAGPWHRKALAGPSALPGAGRCQWAEPPPCA